MERVGNSSPKSPQPRGPGFSLLVSVLKEWQLPGTTGQERSQIWILASAMNSCRKGKKGIEGVQFSYESRSSGHHQTQGHTSLEICSDLASRKCLKMHS